MYTINTHFVTSQFSTFHFFLFHQSTDKILMNASDKALQFQFLYFQTKCIKHDTMSSEEQIFNF